MIEAADWRGLKHTGVVLMSKLNDDCTKGFGFIEPWGSHGEHNVYFTADACQGRSVEKGDVVYYVLMRVNQKHWVNIAADRNRGASRRAFKVWVKSPAIPSAGNKGEHDG